MANSSDPVALCGHALMEQSLTRIGEAGIDIVPRYFARFHAALPDERPRFCNRASSEGLMVNEMLAMLLAQAGREPWLATMMRAQVNTHHDHGEIGFEHYRIAIELLVATLAEAAGPAWTDATARAWRDAADELCALIARFA